MLTKTKVSVLVKLLLTLNSALYHSHEAISTVNLQPPTHVSKRWPGVSRSSTRRVVLTPSTFPWHWEVSLPHQVASHLTAPLSPARSPSLTTITRLLCPKPCFSVTTNSWVVVLPDLLTTAGRWNYSSCLLHLDDSQHLKSDAALFITLPTSKLQYWDWG